MSYEYDTATPYAASYVILRQAEKIVFLLRASGWMEGYYGLPSGKKEKKESFISAGIREAEEEISIVISPKDLKPVLFMDRYETDSDQEWVDVFFEASKWKGKPYNAEPTAHSKIASFAPNNLPENIVPSVRFAIEAIEAEKNYVEYGWK